MPRKGRPSTPVVLTTRGGWRFDVRGPGSPGSRSVPRRAIGRAAAHWLAHPPPVPLIARAIARLRGYADCRGAAVKYRGQLVGWQKHVAPDGSPAENELLGASFVCDLDGLVVESINAGALYVNRITSRGGPPPPDDLPPSEPSRDSTFIPRGGS